jgi:lipoprotein-anchoring transpeptidase ErfK/SrfK
MRRALTIAIASLALTAAPAAGALAVTTAHGARASGTAGHKAGAGTTPPAVTLAASRTRMVYGRSVRFTGRISPASSGQTVDVVDKHGDTLAEATTASDGTYRTSAVPRHNLTVHAQWTTAASDPVKLLVRPRLTATHSALRLFGSTVVRGRLVPASAARAVTVSLTRHGSTVAHTTAKVGSAGRFRARLPVRRFGSQRAMVSAHGAGFSPATWRSGPVTPPTPGLREGSKGIYVRLVQARLAQLHYRIPGADGHFDFRTADAVMAFHKAQVMTRTQTVNRATWRALAAPRTPKPKDHSKGYHFEVDLTKQLLYYVHSGTIVDILHVSTGKPSTPTHPGRFHVDQKQPGFNRDDMYYSSFFDGNRALHGYAEVPSYAASHGCVRIPYWNAKWTYNRAPLGILVYVYN